MKNILMVLFSASCLLANGQNTVDYNRWSFDMNLGVNKAVRNYTPGYHSAIAGIGEINLGARFMVNTFFGFDMKFGFDRFTGDKNSLEYSTNMSRFGIQGVINLGNVLHFYQWTDRLGVLVHGGVGLGNLAQSGFPIYFNNNDRVGTATFGITPQVKIGSKMALNLDVAIIGLSRQHHTWDYQTNYVSLPKGDDYGFNGHIFTGTIGFSYYFGKKDSHADWTPMKTINQSDLDKLAAENEKMRQDLMDDDKDGVPNYLDQQLDTPENTPVDTRGVADPSQMDSDQDGIADLYDACPNEKGTYSTNGCPDSDMDGVADKDDKCPDTPGTMMDKGCAPKPVTRLGGVIGDFGTEYENVHFALSSAEITAFEKKKIEAVAAILKANPSYKVSVEGHADSSGEEAFNATLSNDRAVNVKSSLVGMGINGSRISTKGFSDNQPVDTNNTISGRANNRRVEFYIQK